MHQWSTHAQHDGDDIESDGFVRDTVAAIKQPIASSFPEILLLGRRHGLLRAAVLDGGGRFSLHQHRSPWMVRRDFTSTNTTVCSSLSITRSSSPYRVRQLWLSVVHPFFSNQTAAYRSPRAPNCLGDKLRSPIAAAMCSVEVAASFMIPLCGLVISGRKGDRQMWIP